ncbi:hypothetical protein GCM10022220_37900 [Actinocatenispora rupis]|uniref:Uncharacterized protein n=1 Tax=Actinocatenispora rupis TaxID=519421 RepID=A0A8J3J8J1_9ACTN|nr:hypothetical protein Aru02nite_30060 [Actinocatenispora rupis]
MLPTRDRARAAGASPLAVPGLGSGACDRAQVPDSAGRDGSWLVGSGARPGVGGRSGHVATGRFLDTYRLFNCLIVQLLNS